MYRWLIGLVGVMACSSVAMSDPERAADPPPPPDWEPSRKYGDLPERAPPETRSSTWTVRIDGASHTWEVPCDARSNDALRTVLSRVFEGAEPGEVTPSAPGGPPILEIRWREDGVENAASQLFGDGQLLKVVGEESTLHRVLTPEQVSAVQAGLREAGSGSAQWCSD